MLRSLKIFCILAVGTALGLAATWATVIRSNNSGGVSNGPWRTSHYAGSSEGSPYLRAYIAVHGLLALGREETSTTPRLMTAKAKRWMTIVPTGSRGRDLPARWWSITAYGADDFLMPNPANRYSVSMNSGARRAAGTFAVRCQKNRPRVTGFRSPEGASI